MNKEKDDLGLDELADDLELEDEREVEVTEEVQEESETEGSEEESEEESGKELEESEEGKTKRETVPLEEEQMKDYDKKNETSKSFKDYQKKLQGLESIFGAETSGFRNALRSLNAQYGRKTYAARKGTYTPKVSIPQLARLHELKHVVQKKFDKWLETVQEDIDAIDNYILNELDFVPEGDEDTPTFTLYYSGVRKVENFIKENFEEVKE